MTARVLYLDGLGRFEGPVIRCRPGGFIMTFTCSPIKREKLADQLTLELNRHLLGDQDLRRHDRVEQVSGSYTHFTRTSGEQIRCEVLDLSLTGVSVRTDTKPPVGEHILIGHRAGRVARHHTDGIGVEFFGLGTPTNQPLEKSPPVVMPVQPGASSAFRPQQSAAGGRW